MSGFASAATTRGALRRAVYVLGCLSCLLQVYNLFARKRREAEARSEEARLLAEAICINVDGTVREWTSTDLIDCGKIRSLITNENAWLELFEETLNEYARSQAECIAAAVRRFAEGTRPYVTLISLFVVIATLTFALLVRVTGDVVATRRGSFMIAGGDGDGDADHVFRGTPSAATTTDLIDSIAILPYHHDRRRQPHRRASHSSHPLIFTST
ncbi:hypothetical protein CYMTET_49764 [Cymbomonas tetramitiformis]|uniref:Uncharacterized protein n=1 Tax=Cymbomonas tetramitiformis TaxID=36881 RepID=A0AAE0BRJ1_9CHLO|nr:hypothetical protein CYMTET_49764 [Cymbomonas tetramitiformis]